MRTSKKKTIIPVNFAMPGIAYRGKPFWAWNGRLDKQELKRQIHLFKAMGFGGFVMHSRVGLITEYLSDEWFDCIGTCIEEAKKLGLEAWLYDEDRWPSGSAGGLVTVDPANSMRYLTVDELRDREHLEWSKDVVAVFSVHKKKEQISMVKRIRKNTNLTADSRKQTVLIFRIKLAPKSDFYNGQTYLDTLNTNAVRAFINSTHEKYKKHFEGHFGKTVMAMFTDEPQHGGMLDGVGIQSSGDGTGIPWTDTLPDVFRTRYGYDILDYLPELFFDKKEKFVSQARWHYHDCVTYMFSTAFAQQIGEWCAQNEIRLTGHMLMEDTLSSQAKMVGSCMRSLQYMQLPGVDVLTEYWRVYGAVKQTVSVARQFNRSYRLTETYGCTGWDFSLEGHKALTDWQTALGINQRCSHLAWYTAEGERKRDYPASTFYQSPWWDVYGRVEDYYARINTVMAQGKEVRNILVIHPVESMWLMCRRGWTHDPAVNRMDDQFISITNELLDANLDFDYGDEAILAEIGSVNRKCGHPVLMVGRAEYTTVVVPPMLTLRSTTLKLIMEFNKSGGAVVFAGKPAEYVDALLSRAVCDFAEQCDQTVASGDEFIKTVARTGRSISISDPDGNEVGPALYLLKEGADAYYLFIANTGSSFKKTRRIKRNAQLKNDSPPADVAVCDRNEVFEEVYITGFADAKGYPIELCPLTGKVVSTKAERVNGAWRIRSSLERLGSRLFVIPKEVQQFLVQKNEHLKVIRKSKIRPKQWIVALSEGNVCMLDMPECRVNEKVQKAADVLRIDRRLRDQLKLSYRSGAMLQPWKVRRNEDAEKLSVKLTFRFEVGDILPSGGISLGLENPTEYSSIFLNGSPVNVETENGWWFDTSLRCIPVNPAWFQPGTNKLELSLNFSTNHPGLEPVYLLGNFSVSLKQNVCRLGDPVRSLAIGSWVTQGLPFFSGNVIYQSRFRAAHQSDERVFLKIPEVRGSAVRIYVNGYNAGVLMWEPRELDITSFLKEGEQLVAIEVIGHRRNSHGPFHSKIKNNLSIGPGSFVTEGSEWTADYRLVPCGLMKPPELLIKGKCKVSPDEDCDG